jgi:hypothetical protein
LQDFREIREGAQHAESMVTGLWSALDHKTAKKTRLEAAIAYIRMSTQKWMKASAGRLW